LLLNIENNTIKMITIKMIMPNILFFSIFPPLGLLFHLRNYIRG